MIGEIGESKGVEVENIGETLPVNCGILWESSDGVTEFQE